MIWWGNKLLLIIHRSITNITLLSTINNLSFQQFWKSCIYVLIVMKRSINMETFVYGIILCFFFFFEMFSKACCRSKRMNICLDSLVRLYPASRSIGLQGITHAFKWEKYSKLGQDKQPRDAWERIRFSRFNLNRQEVKT